MTKISIRFYNDSEVRGIRAKTNSNVVFEKLDWGLSILNTSLCAEKTFISHTSFVRNINIIYGYKRKAGSPKINLPLLHPPAPST